MVVDCDHLLKAAQLVAEQEEMKVNLKWSAAGGLLTGFTAMAGSLVAGPIGLFLGGTLGGLTSMFVANGKYKSLVSIIKEDLTPAQRNELAEHIEEAFRKFDPVTDILPIVMFLAEPNANELLYKEIGKKLMMYVTNNLNSGPVQFRNDHRESVQG